MRGRAELTRGIKQVQVATNPEPAQLLGHAWLWCALTHSPAQEPVDQSRLANIGETNDCCPDRPWLQASGFAAAVDAIAQ